MSYNQNHPLKLIFHKILFALFKILPLKKDCVVFINLHSDKFEGNNKKVYDYMLENYTDLILKVFLLDEIKLANLNLIQKFKKTVEIDYHISRASIVVVNDYFSLFNKVTLKRNAQLIQLWHAGGALKKFGLDSLASDSKALENARKVHSQYSKVFVSSEVVSPIYAKAFGIDESKVYSYGLPRTDDIVNKSYQQKIKEELYSKYPQLKDKKIVLFAPTFRDNDRRRNNIHINFENLIENLNEEYFFAIKLHPFERGNIVFPNRPDRLLNLSVENINDLVVIADILVTDYSTVMFDFAVLNKPMIFYAYDLEEYTYKIRGFYYDYRSLVPGPIVKGEEELLIELNKLEDVMDFPYKNNVMDFANRFNADIVGTATKKVVEEILK